MARIYLLRGVAAQIDRTLDALDRDREGGQPQRDPIRVRIRDRNIRIGGHERILCPRRA
jgi:hypothetical protein